jgi:hypothetical protein
MTTNVKQEAVTEALNAPMAEETEHSSEETNMPEQTRRRPADSLPQRPRDTLTRGTDGSDGPSAASIAERVLGRDENAGALEGVQPAGSQPASWQASLSVPHQARARATEALGQLRDWPGPPEPVAAAETELRDAARSVHQAADALELAFASEKRENAARLDAAREQARTGQDAALPAFSRDWSDEQVKAQGRLDVAVSRLNAAGRGYEQAVAENLLTWRAEHAARLPETELRAALATAAAAWRAWKTAVGSQYQLHEAVCRARRSDLGKPSTLGRTKLHDHAVRDLNDALDPPRQAGIPDVLDAALDPVFWSYTTEQLDAGQDSTEQPETSEQDSGTGESSTGKRTKR